VILVDALSTASESHSGFRGFLLDALSRQAFAGQLFHCRIEFGL